MIVTGVKNVNRNRDYVPRKDIYFDDTGEADKFLDFVAEEWIEYVDREFHTTGERILIGHSFGGVFTLHTLFRRPEIFDAYIALGSSAWIADRILFEEAVSFFETSKNSEAFVYMAVGEGDGGPTVPSSADLAELFEERAPESLEWTFKITPKADHFKNFAAGLHDAFMVLFPAWKFEEEVRARGESQGAAGVNAWFDEKRSALGFRFKPAWFDMGVTATALSRDSYGEAALALTAQLRNYYPQNPHVAAFSATVYENLKRFDLAEHEILRAIAIAKEQKLHPNEIHIDQLQRRLDRLRDAQEN
jgi:pimeloyl-ACP methyl ester carboxylesterase